MKELAERAIAEQKEISQERMQLLNTKGAFACYGAAVNDAAALATAYLALLQRHERLREAGEACAGVLKHSKECVIHDDDRDIAIAAWDAVAGEKTADEKKMERQEDSDSAREAPPMNPLVEEARGIVGFFDVRDLIPSISGESGTNGYRLGLIRRLAAALEAAEKRAEEGQEAWSDIVDMLSAYQPEHTGSVMEMLRDLGNERNNLIEKEARLRDSLGDLRVTMNRLRALVPELRALDEAGKKATKGEWRVGKPNFRCQIPEHGTKHPGAGRGCVYTYDGWHDQEFGHDYYWNHEIHVDKGFKEGASTHEEDVTICGNYDYECGGVVDVRDTDFIALAANARAAMAKLLREIEGEG